MRRLSLCVVVVAMLGFGGTIHAAVFLGLGDIPGGQFYSLARDLSADGAVVVGNSRSASGYQAFRWTQETGMVGIGELPGGVYGSEAIGVSADGSVIVGESFDGSGARACYWTDTGSIVNLGPGIANAVSADGSVIVGSSHAHSGVAFRWTESDGMGSTNNLGESRGVSADGSVVVGSGFSPFGHEAFRFVVGEGTTFLGDLSGGDYRSTALGVSADGEVVVGYSKTALGDQAFRWTQETGMVGLGYQVGWGESLAYDASADGSVIVGRATDASFGAFIWDATNGMRSIKELLTSQGANVQGWLLMEAFAVSADGLTIAGRGKNPDGNNEAWLATLSPTPEPIPEPSTLAIWSLLGLCGFGIGWRRRRKA